MTLNESLRKLADDVNQRKIQSFFNENKRLLDLIVNWVDQTYTEENMKTEIERTGKCWLKFVVPQYLLQYCEFKTSEEMNFHYVTEDGIVVEIYLQQMINGRLHAKTTTYLRNSSEKINSSLHMYPPVYMKCAKN